MRELRERGPSGVEGSEAEFEAIRSIAAKPRIGSPETLHTWVPRAKINGGQQARKQR
jgi:hypothetical protein